MKRLLHIILTFFILIAILAAGSYLLVLHKVHSVADSHMYATAEEAPKNSVAMVLGAQVLNEVPSTVLAYRLTAAISLYKSGKVNKLLMSGDGRSRYYDEVKTMHDYAVEAGVPEADIITDSAGLRTYSSCYRAKHEFGLTKLTIVTQSEHLLRAVYTCRELGIDASGFTAPELTDFKPESKRFWQSFLREKGALVLAWMDVNVIHPAE